MAFRTPARPLPGAFINTPAPSRFPPPRQPIFQSQPVRNPSGATPPNQQQQNPPQRETLQPIQRAARTINEVLQREANFPDLDNYIKQTASVEYDLPNNTTEVAWQPFQRTELHEIPDKIYDQYNRAEVSTSMGLFAELNHAWITIDNSLYLWDYTAPNPEIIGFEDQSNTITCVKLVKPRAGVFVDSISHLLVVATTAEVILLGVSTSVEKPDPSARLQGPGKRTVSLYQTKMSLSIKGINVQAIEGSSATGRIFFCGKESIDIYELTYQQEEKWFASRCGKVNHTSPGYKSLVPLVWTAKDIEYCHQIVVDDSRRLVYTLSSQSTIRTHHMDTPTTLTQVIEKKRNECLRDISHMLQQPTPLLSNSTKICSISAISAREASKLHLMATTNTGIRIFMSATRGYGYAPNGAAPQNMQVQHVRFPPRVTPRPRTERDQNFGELKQDDMQSQSLIATTSASRYPPGMFFCFVKKAGDEGHSSLFVSSPDSGRIAKSSGAALQYYEQGCWIKLDSQAEDIGLVTKPFAAAKQPVGFGNELAVQYDEPPQEVAILTNTGVHVIRRRRLVDIFASALLTHGAEEGLGQEIKKFIQNYGRAEIISTALAVACGQGRDVSPNDRSNLSRQSNPLTIAAAEKAFVEFGGKPSLDENQISEGPAQSVENVRPSSRHDGMALYMSRLVRSLWKSPVITQVTPAKGGGLVQITSTIQPSKLSSIQENLMKLANFLEKNKSFIEGLAGPESLQRAGSQQEQIALQGEPKLCILSRS
jgi:nuclear pore complex protein Nup155